MSPLISFLTKKSEVVRIQSPLGVEECVAALKKGTLNDSIFKTMFVDSGTILCKFDGSNFRLRQKRSYGNAFAPFFYGKLRKSMNGTEISGEFRMHPSVVASMTLWFGFLLLFGGTMVFKSLVQLSTGHYDHGKNANPLVGVVGPIIMLVFGAALVKFGKLLARSEKTHISHLLQQTFSVSLSPSDCS